MVVIVCMNLLVLVKAWTYGFVVLATILNIRDFSNLRGINDMTYGSSYLSRLLQI